jgi:formyltetrahydrofolate deformylase
VRENIVPPGRIPLAAHPTDHVTNPSMSTAEHPAPLPDPVTMRLVVSCEDRVGIVAAISRFLADCGANIESSHQFSTDPSNGTFFLRMQFVAPAAAGAELRERFQSEVAVPLGLSWRIRDVRDRTRIALLVSRQDHCLQELLWRWRNGELDGEIVLVASNHPDLRTPVEAAGLPYHHIPVSKEDKPVAEARLLELLEGRCDVVVLARYMQILSDHFLERVAVPVINIHHSFLPAFAGAAPYERAHKRGVKLIGATAHYVTEDLDEGPIIEQDVIRVNHEHDVTSLKRLGAHIERSVLARAVQWHCQDRVLAYQDKTVVF